MLAPWLSALLAGPAAGAAPTITTLSADFRPGGTPGGGVRIVDASIDTADLTVPALSGLVVGVTVTVDLTKSLDDINPDGTPTGEGSSTFNGEIELDLISPWGTEVVLVANGTYSGQAQSVTAVLNFDQSAAEAVGGTEIISGTYRPIQSLNAFVGEAAAGDWTLRFRDVAGSDPLSVNAWGLSVTSANADLDGDGDIDVRDWYTLASNYTGPVGAAGGKVYAQGDVNEDGDIDFLDFLPLETDLHTVPGSSSAFQPPADAMPAPGDYELIYDRRDGGLSVLTRTGLIDAFEVIAGPLTPNMIDDIDGGTPVGQLGGEGWFVSVDPGSANSGLIDLPVSLPAGLSRAQLQQAVTSSRYSANDGAFDQSFSLVYLVPGDTDADGDIDIVDWHTANLNYTGPGDGSVFKTYAEGDYDGDTDIDLFDIVLILNEIMSTPSLPAEAKPVQGTQELIYDPATGELQIDTKAGLIEGYEILAGDNDFIAPPDAQGYLGVLYDQPPDSTNDGFNQGFITSSHIIELDLGAANTGVFSFGQVLPAGLTHLQFLNAIAYARYSDQGGEFDRSFKLIYLGEPLLPGDTDGDGDIDDSDLGTVFANFTGPTGPAGNKTAADGDTDTDGDVDDIDLANIFSFFTGPNALRAVPEPGSCALLALGGCMVARRRRTTGEGV